MTEPTVYSPQTEPAAAPEIRMAQEFLEEAPTATAGQALRAYGSQVRASQTEQQILQYLPLVHRIVSQVVSYLHPPLSREDLVSAGTIGLVKAAHDYDPSKDAEFKTYAYIRIRGAVIDELRQWSFAPPSLSKQFEQVQEAGARLLEEKGQPPTDEELADAVQMPLEKLYQLLETARARHFLSIHGMDDEAPALGECLADSGEPEPSHRLEREELVEHLAKAIQNLPKKQRRVIVLYYQRELTMKQIAEVLDVTESRVCQLHAAALFALSTALRGWKAGGDA
ncbi:MAG TPA: FliA/WhiG family RNA polymerase sigma factor [Anaerohalosphaeraceae bacterium]|mgnify:CR=1 FL=1|nr:FliA/WhiG family RNA polymerase sigma factor [Anaerohalosphaeraceae bacterium]HOL88485.1 FliA/WhiG family RNA polymerase sigma factor [Anaerohalosphaeraceae bacterium]HPP56507.1 FliA/WhiG family RNA polymerase sigma factor [Anaerohalosphaeraceae bacterium]